MTSWNGSAARSLMRSVSGTPSSGSAMAPVQAKLTTACAATAPILATDPVKGPSPTEYCNFSPILHTFNHNLCWEDLVGFKQLALLLIPQFLSLTLFLLSFVKSLLNFH